MRRLNFLLIALLGFTVTMSFYGCKKECQQKTGCSNTKDSGRIAAVLHSNGKWFHLFYNGNDKLNKVTSGSTVTNYAYTGNTTIVTSLDSGRFVSKTIIILNDSGLAVNVRMETNAAGTIWNNTVYEYNGLELVKSTLTLSDGGSPMISTYNWTNQNLSSITSGTTVNTFSYYIDKPEQDGDYLGLLQLLQGFKIYSNKNLLKSISGVLFTYEFDEGGKITSADVTNGTNADIFDYQVIYQCK